jgi:hypothetical protein
MALRLFTEIWLSSTISASITGGFVQLWNTLENNKTETDKLNIASKGFRDGLIIGGILGITSPIILTSVSIYKLRSLYKK